MEGDEWSKKAVEWSTENLCLTVLLLYECQIGISLRINMQTVLIYMNETSTIQ